MLCSQNAEGRYAKQGHLTSPVLSSVKTFSSFDLCYKPVRNLMGFFLDAASTPASSSRCQELCGELMAEDRGQQRMVPSVG